VGRFGLPDIFPSSFPVDDAGPGSIASPMMKTDFLLRPAPRKTDMNAFFPVLFYLAVVMGPTSASGAGFSVRAWGLNTYGETAVPNGLTNAVAVAGGLRFSLALTYDGRVFAWGDSRYRQTSVPGGLTNVVAIAAGRDHCLVLRADGTVVAWGANDHGQTTVPHGLTNGVAIAAGDAHNLVLRADGTVVAWGAGQVRRLPIPNESKDYGQSDVPPQLTNAVAVAAGWAHSLALRADGTVVAWGGNNFGQTNVPESLRGVVAIVAGSWCSIAVRPNGTVAAWGLTSLPEHHFQVSELDNCATISAGALSGLGLRRDGGLVGWGFVADADPSTGDTCATLTNVVAVAKAYNHCLALVGQGERPHLPVFPPRRPPFPPRSPANGP
jgi:hypothetical protein